MQALAAADNSVPFYVAFPSSTIDWRLRNGKQEIPIEQRGAAEVGNARGLDVESGEPAEVRRQRFELHSCSLRHHFVVCAPLAGSSHSNGKQMR